MLPYLNLHEIALYDVLVYYHKNSTPHIQNTFSTSVDKTNYSQFRQSKTFNIFIDFISLHMLYLYWVSITSHLKTSIIKETSFEGSLKLTYIQF